MGCNCGGKSNVAYAVTLKNGAPATGSPFPNSFKARQVQLANPGSSMKPVPKPTATNVSGPRR